jgi:pimeloyl-ACP methyl ester carboxylesterase
LEHLRAIRLPRHADVIEEMLQQLGIDQVDVFGVSWGAALAQECALRYPSMVRRLILADWTGFYEEHNGTLDSVAGEEAINHLDSRPLEEIKGLLSSAGYDQRMLDAAFEASFEDWEGVEDSEILNMRKVQPDSSDVFVDYKFDFRMLFVKLLMTHSHYYSDKYYIDSQGEADLSDDIVEVELLVRADLTASVIFNPEDDVVSSVETNKIAFRKLR